MTTDLTQISVIVRNDLRLLRRAFWAKKKTAVWLLSVIGLAIVGVQVLTIFGFKLLPEGPALTAQAIVWAFIGFLMLGASMTHAISLLYERSDFDLLLSSPISARVVLLSRIIAIASSAWLGSAFILLPLINAAVFTRSASYSAAYLVWFFLAVLCASLGTNLTMLVVRWIGPRRARTWIQVFGASIGASIYLSFQLPQMVAEEKRWEIMMSIKELIAQSPFVLVANAGRGELGPLAIIAGLSLLAAILTGRMLARTFLGDLQVSTDRRSHRRKNSVFKFQDGVFRATFLKEVRLILRDPLLLSNVLPSVMYILPALFGVRSIGWSLLAPVSVVVAVQFSLLLTSVAVGGEEGLDLIRSSPMTEVRLRKAKMAASMFVPLVLSTLLCVGVVVVGRPGLALIAWLTGAITAIACTWVRAADVSPSPRADILKQAQKKFSIRSLVTGAIMLLAVAAVGVLAGNGPILLSVLMLGVLGLAIIACFTFVEAKELSDDT